MVIFQLLCVTNARTDYGWITSSVIQFPTRQILKEAHDFALHVPSSRGKTSWSDTRGSLRGTAWSIGITTLSNCPLHACARLCVQTTPRAALSCSCLASVLLRSCGLVRGALITLEGVLTADSIADSSPPGSEGMRTLKVWFAFPWFARRAPRFVLVALFIAGQLLVLVRRSFQALARGWCAAW